LFDDESMLDLSYKEDKDIIRQEIQQEEEVAENKDDYNDELDLSGTTLLQNFSESKKQVKFSFLRFAKQN
jgi:hypothetical protein